MAKRKFHIAVLLVMLVSFCLAGDSFDYIPRISYVDGDVSLQERGSTGWTTVDVNLPIQIGDRLVLDQNGLIEIEIDDGSFLRVNQFSEFMFQNLEKDRIVIELVRGEVIARTTDAADYVFLTAAGDVVLRSEGLYRINARDDRSVELIVRSGKARFINDKIEKKLGRNERIVVYGLSDQFVMGGGNRFDDFDNWSDRRDSRYASASETYRYIPRTVYAGAADLDLYGRWVFVADYGHCWIPTVYYSGWAPYRAGYWRYSPVWGYTWISYDPWGWLPYHYGSWAFTGPFGWVWVPGSSWGCSWWAPGRVHWGFWNGYVGWVPCGPGDYYYGYWRHGHDHNVYVNNVVVNNYYGSENTRHNGAVTYVSEEDFRRGRPVGDGVYNRNAVGRSVQRQEAGSSFRPDETISRELFRRDRVVAGPPKVDPVRSADASYSRSRAGGDVDAGTRISRDAGSSTLPASRSREAIAGETGSGSSVGRSTVYGTDSGSINRGRPDISRNSVQDSSRSRQADDSSSGSSYRRSGSTDSAGSSGSSGSIRGTTTGRGSSSIDRSSSGSRSGTSSSSGSTSRSIDRSSLSGSSSRSSSPPPAAPTRSTPTREKKTPSPSDSYSRVFSTAGSDVRSAYASSGSSVPTGSNNSFNRSTTSSDNSPAYGSMMNRGRGFTSSSIGSNLRSTPSAANNAPAVTRSASGVFSSSSSRISSGSSFSRSSAPSVSAPSRNSISSSSIPSRSMSAASSAAARSSNTNASSGPRSTISSSSSGRRR
ncbi:MAG: FecR domain-containing protein [Acidobacteria bacterium]|nr:FecR domain-containing protein [Acidobacteriota bacterium]